MLRSLLVHSSQPASHHFQFLEKLSKDVIVSVYEQQSMLQSLTEYEATSSASASKSAEIALAAGDLVSGNTKFCKKEPHVSIGYVTHNRLTLSLVSDMIAHNSTHIHTIHNKLLAMMSLLLLYF